MVLHLLELQPSPCLSAPTSRPAPSQVHPLNPPPPLVAPAPCAVAQPDDIAAFSLQSSHPLHKTSKVRVPHNRADYPLRQRVCFSVAAANDSWLLGWCSACNTPGRAWLPHYWLPRYGPTHPPIHPALLTGRYPGHRHFPCFGRCGRDGGRRRHRAGAPVWRVCAVAPARCALSLALPIVPEGCT